VDWQHNVINIRQALYWKFGKHIRPKEGELFVFIPPKSETSIREIDMSPALKKELRQRYLTSQKTGLIFPAADGKPHDPNGFVRREFSEAVKGAGLGKVRFHDLRHTFGSLKIEQGENIYYVQRQMGHSSIQVTIEDRHLRASSGNEKTGCRSENGRANFRRQGKGC
jgi:integrase